MKTPNRLTDNELLRYADKHLNYEYDMFVNTMIILYSLEATKRDGRIAFTCHDALLNSFSIHSRNLVDFLYLRELKRDRPTDIIIQDYIDEKLLKELLPPISDILKEVLQKANKQVAHLTLDRIKYEEEGKEWYLGVISEEIINCFNMISSAFPSTKISEEFRTKISKSIFPFRKLDSKILINKLKQPIGLQIVMTNDLYSA